MHLVCFSDITWNFLWQRQQQLVSRFPKEWKILYVEPSYWLSAGWSMANRIPFKRNYMPQENIEVLSVPTIPLGDGFGPTRRANDTIISRGIKNILRDRRMSNPVLLFYKPRYSCVIGRLGESAILYDITDDTREFDASPGWLDQYIHTLETRSDMIFTSSEKMHQRLQQDGTRPSFLIGNGVEASHFEKASLPETRIPPDLQDLPSPVIGYVGAVGEWFDFELLERILEAFPHGTIVLIGWIPSGQKGRLRRLKSKNLHVLGTRQYADLPGYIKKFDVCIIPFLQNRLTESVNPNKFYEYLAAGKPIVATALPELEKFASLCKIAKDHDEFIQHIRKAATETHAPEGSLDTARQNDWSGKAARMVELIGSLGR